MLQPSSHEFIALCETQVLLLTQLMGASWSAVYLSEKWLEPDQPRLRPIVAYPPCEPQASDALPFSPRDMGDETVMAASTSALTVPSMPWEESSIWGRRQVIFPLLHDEMVLGLLVSRRVDRAWYEPELSQVRQVAHTLGLACFLDQQGQQLQQELKQLTARRQQRQAQIDTVLHQLRSPITALRTLGKLLLKRFLPGDRNHTVIESLVRQSDRLQWLLQQLETILDQTPRPTYAFAEPQPTPLLRASEAPSAGPLSLLPSASISLASIDLDGLLKPMLVAAAEVAHQQRIVLTYQFHDTILSVQGDTVALQEIFSNLIDNAIKYTPSGGQIRVEVGLEAGNDLGVAVQDDGVGIPVEDQAHIFERHYRGVQAQGAIPGTGLGLAIAQELLNQMQGRIEVISPNPGQTKGTTFIVWLPLA